MNRLVIASFRVMSLALADDIGLLIYRCIVAWATASDPIIVSLFPRLPFPSRPP